MKNATSKAILLFAIILGLSSCSSNFDINKEGGIRMVVEVSGKDFLDKLASSYADSTYREAIALAYERHWHEDGDLDFITQFVNAAEEINPDIRLAPLFLYNLKDEGLDLNATNKELLQILQDKYNETTESTKLILTKRLENYFKDAGSFSSPIKYNIRKAEIPGRIIVELSNDDRIDLPRVYKLISCTVDLEFWETYNLNDNNEGSIVNQYLKDVNAFYVERNKEYGLYEDDDSTDNDSWDDNFDDLFETAEGGYEDLMQLVMSAEDMDNSEADKDLKQFYKENPLYAELTHYGNGACIGIAHPKDTAAINRMFAETRNLPSYPRNLKLAWTVKPEDKYYYEGENSNRKKVIDYEGVLDLVALKIASGDTPFALGGEVITEAQVGFNQSTNAPEVEIQMNQDGTKKWKEFTGNNIGRQIAIVIDNYVFMYPIVNSEIQNGRSVISGNFTVEEAQDIANALNSGSLLVPALIIEEVPVEPMKDNK